MAINVYASGKKAVGGYALIDLGGVNVNTNFTITDKFFNDLVKCLDSGKPIFIYNFVDGDLNYTYGATLMSAYWNNGAQSFYLGGSNNITCYFSSITKTGIVSNDELDIGDIMIQATSSDGVSVIDGQGSTKIVGCNIHLGTTYGDGLPTSDPQEEGQVWNDNGTLKVSQG